MKSRSCSEVVIIAVDVSDFHMSGDIARYLGRMGVAHQTYFFGHDLLSHTSVRALMNVRRRNVTFIDTSDYAPHSINEEEGEAGFSWWPGLLKKVFNFLCVMRALIRQGRSGFVLFHQHVDSITMYVSWLSRIFRQRIILIPAHYPVRDSQIKARLREGKLSSKVFRNLVRKTFPKWFEHWGDDNLARISPIKILIHEILGMSPRDPWMAFNYYCHALIIDDSEDHDQWTALAFDESVVKVAGRPSDLFFSRFFARPKLAERYRRRSLRIPPSQPNSNEFICLLIAPNQQKKYTALGDTHSLRACMYSNYEEYLKDMVDLCQFIRVQLGRSVVVSIHPRNAFETRGVFEAVGITICSVEGQRIPLFANRIISYCGSALVKEFARIGISQLVLDLFGQRKIINGIVAEELIVRSGADVRTKVVKWLCDSTEQKSFESRLEDRDVLGRAERFGAALGFGHSASAS